LTEFTLIGLKNTNIFSDDDCGSKTFVVI